MNFFARQIQNIKFAASLSGMMVLVMLVPAMGALLYLVIAYITSPPIAFLAAGLLFVIIAAVSAMIFRLARLYSETTIERYELKSIIAGLADALVAYDQNFRVLYFNAAAEKIFKLPASAVVRTEIRSQDAEIPERRLLVQVMFPSLAPVMVNRSEEGDPTQVVDLSFEDPQVELRVVTTPINDAEGRLLGFVKIVRDRTREISLLKSKNEFITIASHQLRGPITNVNWALEALKQETSLSENGLSMIENGSAAARELLKIIDDLLNIAKIEEGHFNYAFEPTDMIALINELLLEMLPRVRQIGINLYFDRPEGNMPQVYIDRAKLSMVILNLVENAVRYNIKNGEVIVKVEQIPNQDFLKVSVKDTGIGIPSEAIAKLFQKFFRADNALKVQTEGSGLGLYIAKNIIRSHGGQIGAESQLNRGTTFYFTLPTNQALVPQHEVSLE
jgi:two-component system phosphate regulon sensor histidine kinase PhoR